ncbi:MAG: sigma-70 family RNA polymerase sigma factor [Planctomycetota bacterium]
MAPPRDEMQVTKRSQDADWEWIVRAHAATVWRIARRLLPDEADAADCFQDTFASALTAQRRQPINHWPAFLRKLATARAIDLVRRRIRQRRLAASRHDLDASASGLPAPSEIAEANELAERLRAALAEIPRQQAEVFCLAVLESMPHAEVAEQCGITANHVGVLIHRARARLRPLLTVDSPSQSVTEA